MTYKILGAPDEDEEDEPPPLPLQDSKHDVITPKKRICNRYRKLFIGIAF